MDPFKIARLPMALVLMSSLTFAAPVRADFIPLGDLPSAFPAQFSSRAFAVSNDGTVVGNGFSTFQEASRWTSGGGMVGLGDLPGGFNSSIAYGVSDDGAIVAGEGNALTLRAFEWTSGGGIVNLGKLTGGSNLSRASGVSGDGTVIVGESGSTAAGIGQTEAFRWTRAGGMAALGDLTGGTFQSKAFAASSDGSVIVGSGTSASGGEAFLWTQTGGMFGLGDLPGGVFGSAATDVSADGSVVVGGGTSGSGQEAFRWTQAGGMVGLGDLPGGAFRSVARGVSGDGNLIIGESTGSNGTLGNAFLCDSTNGMRDLKTVLVNDYGYTNLTGWFLMNATGVSTNGRYITGYGQNPDGRIEAWLVDFGPAVGVPEPSSLMLILSGVPGGLRILRRKARLRITGRNRGAQG